MGNSKSKKRRRGESSIQFQLRMKRERSKKRKFRTLPFFRYNPIFGGSNFFGSGGPTLPELWHHFRIKFPKNLKPDSIPTSVLSGRQAKCKWRWVCYKQSLSLSLSLSHTFETTDENLSVFGLGVSRRSTGWYVHVFLLLTLRISI